MFETNRTAILISALRDSLRAAAHSDEVKQEIATAFYPAREANGSIHPIGTDGVCACGSDEFEEVETAS